MKWSPYCLFIIESHIWEGGSYNEAGPTNLIMDMLVSQFKSICVRRRLIRYYYHHAMQYIGMALTDAIYPIIQNVTHFIPLSGWQEKFDKKNHIVIDMSYIDATMKQCSLTCDRHTPNRRFITPITPMVTTIAAMVCHKHHPFCSPSTVATLATMV